MRDKVRKLSREPGPVQDRIDAETYLVSALPRPQETDTEPDWYGIGPDALERACVQLLSRAGPKSAARLPQLPVAQGEAKVRSTLRRRSYFHELPKGKWQVGRPWCRQLGVGMYRRS